jgi:hypothetical protein
MAGSMDRDEMRRREQEGWSALMAAVERIPPDRRSEPGVVPGWSVKDLVWHCGRWADWVREPLGRIEDGSYQRDRDQAPRRSAFGDPGEQMNVDWAEESKGLSWDEVMSGAEAMRRDAVAALAALPVVDDDAVREFSGETFEHYAEHAAEIARFAEASG